MHEEVDQDATAGSYRSSLVDIARGLAILAMIIFHLFRDLEIFGLLDAGTTLTGGWAIAARAIACSFLFLVGVSLFLAHSDEIDWAAFRRRILVVVVAAAAVTVATLAAIPGRFIYFGILHAIVFASIAGIMFTRAPAWAALLMSAVILLIWYVFGRSLPLDPWWGWTGLSFQTRPTLDLIPVFPWLAATFLGISVAKTVPLARSARPTGQVAASVVWLGRHSLAIYLLHQPILIGAIWAILKTMGKL